LGKTRRELLEGLDSEELSEWMAYDRLDRIPDPYWIAGMITANLFNALTGGKAKIDDFIPRLKPVRILSGEAGMAWFKGAAAQAEAAQKLRNAATMPIHPH
jgi:hypothetical protein